MTKQNNAPKFIFTFTTYQLRLLVALDMGANTSGEIMEIIEDSVDKFARRRCCEAIATLTKCGVLTTEMIGGTRFASIAPEATKVVRAALGSARLAA